MRIAIVVQSPEFLHSAGVRIRYRRIAEAASAIGAAIECITLADLKAAGTFDADVYVFTKVFSPDALILMAHLVLLGRTVAQDLFDDYFSQWGDARLARYRSWLAASAPFTDAVLCTTSVLADLLGEYFSPELVHFVEDPAPLVDTAAMAQLLGEKAERRRREGRLRLVWFGIGDNPFFPVGLRDLVAHGSALSSLLRGPYRVELEVLTNQRALDANALAALAMLPVTPTVKTWSTEVEETGLREADIALLPVSAQAFSRAKSLNRAVTSCSQGCQVLSLGFPLYARLDRFLYRDPEELLRDLTDGHCRLRPDTAGALTDRLAQLASPAGVASAFVAVLRNALERRTSGGAAVRPTRRLCVVHGIQSSGGHHKLAKQLGGLSIKSPFHDARLNYDVRFDPRGDRVEAWVATGLFDTLDPAVGADGEPVKIHDRMYWRLDLSAIGLAEPLAVASVRDAPLASVMSAYPKVMRRITAACLRLFPNSALVVAEQHGGVPVVRMAG